MPRWHSGYCAGLLIRFPHGFAGSNPALGVLSYGKRRDFMERQKMEESWNLRMVFSFNGQCFFPFISLERGFIG